MAVIKFGDLIQTQFDKHLVRKIGQGLPSNDLLKTVLASVLAVTLVWRLKKNRHQIKITAKCSLIYINYMCATVMYDKTLVFKLKLLL